MRLKVIEKMIRKERMSKDEFCKAMPILPTSDEEKPADQAAKFSSEIEKQLKQLTNNEMSPEAIADIFSQEDGSSLLKGGLRSIAGKRASGPTLALSTVELPSTISESIDPFCGMENNGGQHA